MDADVALVGGGIVASAIAYGLLSRGARVTILDGGDRDLRAAHANFGLVWQQGKGLDMPAYHELTRRSVALWADFRAELTDCTAIDLQYEQNGGLQLCQSDAEFERRHADLMRLHNQLGGGPADWEMLDRRDLAKLLPRVAFGPDVVGASFGARDGHANPLRLQRALHDGIVRKGGILRGNAVVTSITPITGGGFTLGFGSERSTAARVVIAAGLGSKAIAAQVGLDIPIRPQRGQILVTERLEPFLSLPTAGLRQTREGTVMIGSTLEETGFDNSTTGTAAAWLSARAIRRIPALGDANLVRQWAGLRIMTPDGHPIYAESESHPGAFVALCHSGITLAAVHASTIADAILAGRLPPAYDIFHHRRFDVPQAA